MGAGRAMQKQIFSLLARSATHGTQTMVHAEAGAGAMQSALLQGLRSSMQQAAGPAATMCRSQLHTSAYQPGAFSRQLLKLVSTAGTPSLSSAATGSLTGIMARGGSASQPAWRSWASAFGARMKSTAAPSTPEAAAASTSSAAAAAAAGGVLSGGEALAAGLSDSARKQLMWWIGGSAVWVYTMVVIGGITRLTRSGLSMTEWKFSGERPPISAEDWQAEYDKYRASPEFKLIHSSMTLDEFKFIFWMEYGHRMWGRFLGLAFVIPGTYFAARRFINGSLARRLGLLFFMGGTQGLVGWWMVRSGLKEPEAEWLHPRVSPYRLAGHLVSAFAIFATLTWTALDLGSPRPLVRDMGEAAGAWAARVRGKLLPFAALVAVTATSGAFVAGMDAGRAYNEYPLMGGQWIPEEYWALWDKGYGIRNFFENTAAVQFDHRTLAHVTAASALGLWGWMRYVVPQGALPRRALLAMDLVVAVTLAQVGLGIWTLLEYVPVHLGSAHQANALNLFTAVLAALHALRPATPGPVAAAVGRLAAPVSVAAVAAIGVAVTQQQ
mmetsp:Transcript_7675/g.19050  ORF Transcript_7675/g.19050 Transcript_7675/m.19050 type:complete len:553 (-) Transcript_7675:242-1900(-)|eukprot:CAMPEP_0202866772 /NCGR_PEP_ID=MMETSP1391-20130828/8353_1 /ASSEMBLY_ACC=CAM_ASM_000867 /TAXON_ID=1034604 /ORGANISM="Chlamydomonas leiostraca, Strain SAG 11-49" /LENGTH=552 /DNA_ID=CAMNT_0049546755 /DNA_START=129 /DNA_END=1787 /DNA_ORIENTATION=+